MDYTQHMKSTQREQDRSDQVKNNAGGYVFAVDKWSRLARFLVLGAEGGTYYVGERKLVRENAQCVSACVAEDPRKFADLLVEFSQAGRAPSQNETFFALCIGLLETRGADRRYLSEQIPKIARTGSHILQLASMFNKLSGRRVGSSRALMSGFQKWYEDKDVSSLCYQTTKYPQRDGWSHGDLIRAVHPKPHGKEVLMSILSGKLPDGEYPAEGLEYLMTKDRLHACTTAKEVVSVLESSKATWEMVPTQFLKEPDVWFTLLTQGVPMTALMRNLGRLSSIGLLQPLSSVEKLIAMQLRDRERIQKARMHPYNVLVARKVYGSGRGLKGGGAWSVSQEVLAALEDCFELSFGNVEAAGTRHVLGIDISSSMTSPFRGGPLSAHESAAAMALIQKRTEPECYTMGFSTYFVDLGITRRDSIATAMQKTQGAFGGTDCAIPVLWASRNNIEVDTFVVYTDCETWAGSVHPYRALQDYRQKTGIAARMVVCGITSSGFTLADPRDPLSLDVAGFDSATPRVIADFAGGRI